MYLPVKIVSKTNTSTKLCMLIFFFPAPVVMAMEKKVTLFPNDEAPIICEVEQFKPHQVRFIADHPKIFSNHLLTSYYSVQALSEEDVRILNKYLSKDDESIPRDLEQNPEEADRLKDLSAYLLIPQLMRYFRYATCKLENKNSSNTPSREFTEKEIDGKVLYRVIQESPILRNQNRSIFFDNLLRNREIIPTPYTVWLPEDSTSSDLIALSRFLNEAEKYTHLVMDGWTKYVYPKKKGNSSIDTIQDKNKKAIYFYLIKRYLRKEVVVDYPQLSLAALNLGLDLVAQAMIAGFIVKKARETIAPDGTFSLPTFSGPVQNLASRFFLNNSKIERFKQKAHILLEQSTPASDSSDSRSGSDEEIPNLDFLDKSEMQKQFTLFCISESKWLSRELKATALKNPKTPFYNLVYALPVELSHAARVKILERKKWRTLQKNYKDLSASDEKITSYN